MGLCIASDDVCCEPLPTALERNRNTKINLSHNHEYRSSWHVRRLGASVLGSINQKRILDGVIGTNRSTAKCIAEIADQIGSKLARNQNRVLNQRMALLQIAEPAPQMLSRETRSADEYRAMANVCLTWARQPLTKDAHRFCVTLARAWLRAAISQDACVSDCSRNSPLAFETRNELPYDRKVLIEDCRATEDEIKVVGYSVGN